MILRINQSFSLNKTLCFLLLILLLLTSTDTTHAREIPIPAGSLIESKNLNVVKQPIQQPVAQWDLPLTQELLDQLGLTRGVLQQTQTIQNVTQVITRPSVLLQGKTPFIFTGITSNNQISLEVNNPTQNRVIVIPDASGEMSLLGQLISGSEIENNSIELTTDTAGNYVKSISSGSGIGLSGTEGEAWSAQVSLGNLTANWSQSGAYDIVLDNASSELKILESDGSSYAIVDAGDLSSDVTYTLSGATGTILTSGNFSSISGALLATNNLSDLGSASTARSNLGLGSIATQNASSIAITGGTLAGLTSYSQDSGNFAISGTGTFSTGTGAISLNGATTVASGKTLAVTTADSLTVGGVIISQLVTVPVSLVATLVDQVVFVADASYKLNAIRCVYSVAALSNGTLQVTVETGTNAPGTGTAQLSSAIDLSTTVNTIYSGALIESPTTISAGNKVSLDVGGTITGLLGTCTLSFIRV